MEIARYAQQRQELAKQKKLPTFEDLNPNTKFVENGVIRIIANSDAVNDHTAARKLGWTRYPELIRTLYGQLTESDYYKEYMQREERSFDDDRRLVEDSFKELQSCEALDDALEEMFDSLERRPALYRHDDPADALEPAPVAHRPEGPAEVQERRRPRIREDALRQDATSTTTPTRTISNATPRTGTWSASCSWTT